jgi:multidrug efflux system membrane fusion protein
VTGENVDGMQLIRSGLKVGERIIADGTHKVRPGMTVSPAPVKK